MSGVKWQDPAPSRERVEADLFYIEQAIELAREAAGEVSPNPLVGAIVVKDGRIVGKGVHRYADIKHAEVLALREAGQRARGATLYTNLEPCSHQGRTPPCSEAIIQAGIVRLVTSLPDPNPRVSGAGLTRLQAAGVLTDVGKGRAEAERLNEVYLKFIRTRRPFVHLKSAMSVNGQIAQHRDRPTPLTGPPARAAVQQLRHAYDAILVGIGTVLADNPLLTERAGRPRHRPLVRVVLDARGRLPLECKLIETIAKAPLLLFTSSEIDSGHKRKLERAGVTVISAPCSATGIDLGFVLDELGRLELTSLIVEGGAQINGSFLSAGFVDKITLFIAPRIMATNDAVPLYQAPPSAPHELSIELRDIQVIRQGDDIEITGYPLMESADAAG